MLPVATLLVTGVGLAYVLGYILRLTYWRLQFSTTGWMPTKVILADIERANKNRLSPPWLIAPSVLWLHHSDAFTHFLLILGLLLGVSSAMGYYPLICIGICSLIYASFQAVHSVCFPVGGHRILANAGILMGICGVVGATEALMIQLVRWTYVLIMFWSGVMKLYSDVGWRRLIHMDYHYWTQPLPSRIGYALNFFPHWFHVLSTFVSLAIEISCPLLSVWNPWTRLLSFIGCNALVLMINAGGHFGFFGCPLYVTSIALLDDHDIAVISAGLPSSLSALLNPDFAWFVSLTPGAKYGLLFYVGLCVYTTVHCFPGSLLSFMTSNRVIDQPILWLLGSFLFSPYYFYWTSPKRRHEGVIEVRSGEGPWQELFFQHCSGPLDKLSPTTFGFWEISTAYPPSRLAEATEWQHGTPIWLRIVLNALRKGNTRFHSILANPPTLPVTEARLKVYDYRFVGQDMHKLWRLHKQLGGNLPATLPPRYLVGEHPQDYWKRELLQTHSLEDESSKQDV